MNEKSNMSEIKFYMDESFWVIPDPSKIPIDETLDEMIAEIEKVNEAYTMIKNLTDSGIIVSVGEEIDAEEAVGEIIKINAAALVSLKKLRDDAKPKKESNL